MPIPVTIPRLGWNMEEGTFVEWLKADGAAVRAGDVVFRLEGEKATEEIESLDAGTLHIPATGPKPGDRIKVGAVIGYLLEPGESAPVVGLADVPARQEQPSPSPPAPGDSPRGSASTPRRSAAPGGTAACASGTSPRPRPRSYFLSRRRGAPSRLA